MSGRVASFTVFETGWPELKSSKWSPPTSRETKTACLPSPISSCQTTHGTVVPPGFSVPAATRGFSASRRAIALSVHASSASWLSAQLPKPCAPEVSRMLVCPAVPFPTAIQWKPPSAVPSATIFAAKTMSLLRSPSIWLGSSSYQTTHATVSFGPVNAMSGSTPERVGSMLSVGSPLSDGSGPLGFRRSSPTCCQQNPFTSSPPVGFVPTGQAVPGTACLTAFATKICRSVVPSFGTPSFSSHVIHGTGSLPATAAPPETEGCSAVRRVCMLRDGMWPGPLPWPEGSQTLAAALKRLAKMFVGHPKAALGSYHVTHGTVRPVPAKSIDGASASAVESMLRDAGKPWVTQAPFLKARTKICWLSRLFCSKVAHGTWTLPAVTAPPATSETPASWFGSIALARSLFTCEPLAGSGRKPARVAGAASSTDRAARPAIVRRRRLAGMVISESRECMRDSSYSVRGASGPGWMPSRIWAAGICLRLGYVRATPKDAKNPLTSRWGAVDDSEGGPARWETHALRHQARWAPAPTPIWRPLPRQSVVTEGRRDGTTMAF